MYRIDKSIFGSGPGRRMCDSTRTWSCVCVARNSTIMNDFVREFVIKYVSSLEKTPSCIWPVRKKAIIQVCCAQQCHSRTCLAWKLFTKTNTRPYTSQQPRTQSARGPAGKPLFVFLHRFTKEFVYVSLCFRRNAQDNYIRCPGGQGKRLPPARTDSSASRSAQPRPAPPPRCSPRKGSENATEGFHNRGFKPKLNSCNIEMKNVI